MTHKYPDSRNMTAPENTSCHHARFQCPKCHSTHTGTDKKYTRNRWLTFQCMACKHIFQKSSKALGAFTNNITPETQITLKITLSAEEWAFIFRNHQAKEDAIAELDQREKHREVFGTDLPPHFPTNPPPPQKANFPFWKYLDKYF